MNKPDNLSYKHPQLSEKIDIFQTTREAAPVIVDSVFKLWLKEKLKEYCDIDFPIETIYWAFYKYDKAYFQLHIHQFGYHIIEYYLNKENFDKFLNNYEKYKKQTFRIWNENSKDKISSLTNDQLISLFHQCKNFLTDLFAIMPASVMIGNVPDDYVNWILEKNKISNNDKTKFSSLILYYPEKSKTIKKNQEIYEKLKDVPDNRKKLAIDELIKEYCYSNSNFKGFNEYTKKDLLKDFNSGKVVDYKDLSLEKEKLYEKLNISIEEKKVLEFLSYSQFVRTERMHYEQMMFAIIDWTVAEIAFRYDINYSHLKFALQEEITNNNLEKEDFHNTLKQRFENGIFFHLNKSGKEFELITEETNKKIEKLKTLAEPNNSINEIKGNPVFQGKVTGIVKIFHNSKTIPPKKPFILVSPMTTPDHSHLLNKCIAIVTDEGGITCHAGIFSREFKIPCIIGTKIATKVLKDGDLVEVDTDKGIVKILEKTK